MWFIGILIIQSIALLLLSHTLVSAYLKPSFLRHQLFKPVLVYALSSKKKNGDEDDATLDNSGIKVIRQDQNYIFLWKTSNVAIFNPHAIDPRQSSNKRQRREATIPVVDWCIKNNNRNGDHDILFQREILELLRRHAATTTTTAMTASTSKANSIASIRRTSPIISTAGMQSSGIVIVPKTLQAYNKLLHGTAIVNRSISTFSASQMANKSSLSHTSYPIIYHDAVVVPVGGNNNKNGELCPDHIIIHGTTSAGATSDTTFSTTHPISGGNDKNGYIGATLNRIRVGFSVLSRAESDTHGHMQLVRLAVSFNQSTTTTTVEELSYQASHSVILQALKEANFECVVVNRAHLIACVKIEEIEISPPSPPRLSEQGHSVSITSVLIEMPTPAKFVKFMRRENLRVERAEELKQQQQQMIECDANNIDHISTASATAAVKTTTTTTTATTSALFCGHNFRVTRGGLVPRPSSEILVHTAVEYLTNPNIKNIPHRRQLASSPTNRSSSSTLSNMAEPSKKVLDLGCGSGALILSILSNLSNQLSFSCDGKVMPFVFGTGVDLDAESLELARLNMETINNNMVSISEEKLSQQTESVDPLDFICRFLQDDFASLKRIVAFDVLKCLKNFLSHCKDTDISIVSAACDQHRLQDWFDSRFGYDIIVCNPPYLSTNAAKARVTLEEESVLSPVLNTTLTATTTTNSGLVSNSVAGTDCDTNITAASTSSLPSLEFEFDCNEKIKFEVDEFDSADSIDSAVNNNSSNIHAGLEAYGNICRALLTPRSVLIKSTTTRATDDTATDLNASTIVSVVKLASLSLIKPDGLLLFQAPGGEKAMPRVLSIARNARSLCSVRTTRSPVAKTTRQRRFVPLEIRKDYRGVDRCLVLKLDSK